MKATKINPLTILFFIIINPVLSATFFSNTDSLCSAYIPFYKTRYGLKNIAEDASVTSPFGIAVASGVLDVEFNNSFMANFMTMDFVAFISQNRFVQEFSKLKKENVQEYLNENAISDIKNFITNFELIFKEMKRKKIVKNEFSIQEKKSFKVSFLGAFIFNDGKKNYLQTFQKGNSRLMVLRPTRSEDRENAFYYKPVFVTFSGLNEEGSLHLFTPGTVNKARSTRIGKTEIRKRDIVIAGSPGLFDNLYIHFMSFMLNYIIAADQIHKSDEEIIKGLLELNTVFIRPDKDINYQALEIPASSDDIEQPQERRLVKDGIQKAKGEIVAEKPSAFSNFCACFGKKQKKDFPNPNKIDGNKIQQVKSKIVENGEQILKDQFEKVAEVNLLCQAKKTDLEMLLQEYGLRVAAELGLEENEEEIEHLDDLIKLAKDAFQTCKKYPYFKEQFESLFHSITDKKKTRIALRKTYIPPQELYYQPEPVSEPAKLLDFEMSLLGTVIPVFKEQEIKEQITPGGDLLFEEEEALNVARVEFSERVNPAGKDYLNANFDDYYSENKRIDFKENILGYLVEKSLSKNFNFRKSEIDNFREKFDSKRISSIFAKMASAFSKLENYVSPFCAIQYSYKKTTSCYKGIKEDITVVANLVDDFDFEKIPSLEKFDEEIANKKKVVLKHLSSELFRFVKHNKGLRSTMI